MDQHPIPQDVTGFQFKLIGSMTVKQFGYVAVGVISAVILYYLPLHFALSFLVKTLLIPAFGASGFILAFLPIDGRPIDVMAGNFMKAFMSPNQYVYHKVGYTFSFSSIVTAKQPETQGVQKTAKSVGQDKIDRKALQLQSFLQSSQKQVKNSLDEKEFAFLKSVATTQMHASPLPTPAGTLRPTLQRTGLATMPQPAHTPVMPLPSIQVAQSPLMPSMQTANTAHLAQTTAAVPQLSSVKPAPATETVAPVAVVPPTHEKVSALEQQIQQAHAEKLRLEEELQRLKQQQVAAQPTAPAAVQPVPVPTPAPAMSTPAVLPPTPVAPQPTPQAAPPPQPQPAPVAQVKTVPQMVAKNTMVPHIPDTPNILVGLVKDARGNVLPHILVEVKDKDGNPVRAFKTNALGQFASATPLANGIYTIELEDPKRLNSFDAIQVIANNKIILPLEVISHDAREQLRRELFN